MNSLGFLSVEPVASFGFPKICRAVIQPERACRPSVLSRIGRSRITQGNEQPKLWAPHQISGAWSDLLVLDSLPDLLKEYIVTETGVLSIADRDIIQPSTVGTNSNQFWQWYF
jgi:hypothetical protein